ASMLLTQLLLSIAGALAVDVGLRDQVTGVASGAHALGVHTAAVVAILLHPLLDDRPIGVTTRALAVALALPLVAVGLLGQEEPATLAPRRLERSALRSRGFWGAVLFLFWVYALHNIAEVILRHRGPKPPFELPALSWVGPTLVCGCACAYIVRSRFLRPR